MPKMENVTIHIISHKIGDSNRSNFVAYLVCLGATVNINVSWYILKYLRNGWMDFFQTLHVYKSGQA